MKPASRVQNCQSALAPRWLLAAATALVLVAAGPLAAADTAYLSLSADGLEDLGPGWVYEGWLIVNGAPESAGTFTVSATGMLSQTRFAVPVSDMESVSAYVLTIEPYPDPDPAPSAVHILAGEFAGGSAELSVGSMHALGDDFSSAAGSYILNAPSGGDMASYENGIWWLDPPAGPGPTLELPMLPDGWVYEGWVVGEEGPMSTGRFTMASGADSDGAGVTGGPFAFPPFPGQDLVNPTTDLTAGYAAVISVEPEPDNSPGPFTLKPLVDMMIEDVGAGVLQAMDLNLASFPSATATMHEAMPAPVTAHLGLHIQGLEDLGPDWVYEGWLIVDGAPVSTGTFTVSGGVMSESHFSAQVASMGDISTFVLTIEPADDPDPAPSHVHLVGGDFVGSRAALGVDHAAAIGTDFSAMAGSYILNAPSGDGAVPYTNGIWWLDPPAGPGPTLELPELPDGWVYEGWVVGDDGPISTGRFTMASGADSDGAGETGGAAMFPPFPGQDFVDPARDLTSGYATVISVEPEPDTGAGPFAIKPLIDRMIDDVGAGVLQPMSQNPMPGLASGTAVLLDAAVIPAGAHGPGLNDTQWYTDLVLANRSSEPTQVAIMLVPGAGGMADTATVSLPAWGSMRYGDVFDALFSYTGSGALKVLAEPGMVDVASRTYTTGPDGSYGQTIDPYAMADVVGFGSHARLVNLAYSSDSSVGFRSNIGFVNLGAAAADVMVELYAADGSSVGHLDTTVAAGAHLQLTDVFGMAGAGDLDDAWALVSTDTVGAHLLTYASVVDNQTGDSIFVRSR